MKLKILLGMTLFASHLLAFDTDVINKALQTSMPHDANITVLATENFKDAQYVIAGDTSKGMYSTFLIHNGLAYQIAGILRVSDQADGDLAKIRAMLDKLKATEIQKIITKLSSDDLILFNAKKAQGTKLYVLDALCPHCRDELKTIEEEIKAGKPISVLPVAFLGEQSLQAASSLYDSKKDLDAIKAFFSGQQDPSNITNASKERVLRIKEVLQGSIINAVPFKAQI